MHLFGVVTSPRCDVSYQCRVWLNSETAQKIVTRWKSSHLRNQKLLRILACQFREVKLLRPYNWLVLAKKAQQKALLNFTFVLLDSELFVFALNLFHLSYQRVWIVLGWSRLSYDWNWSPKCGVILYRSKTEHRHRCVGTSPKRFKTPPGLRAIFDYVNTAVMQETCVGLDIVSNPVKIGKKAGLGLRCGRSLDLFETGWHRVRVQIDGDRHEAMFFDNLNHITYIDSSHYYLRSFGKFSNLEVQIEGGANTQCNESFLPFWTTLRDKNVFELLNPVVCIAFFSLKARLERLIEDLRSCVYI